MGAKPIARLIVLLALCAGSAVSAAPKHSHHARIETAHGPVHVWTPAHYDHDTAGIVVYVHGYFIGVDAAWRSHRLARQFAESGVNAMFIACESPTGPDDDIAWPSIEGLLETVADHLEGELPEGRVVAIGHSGAHRTVSTWLDDRLDTIALIDALYGEMPGLHEWLEESEDRRLIDVGALTRRWTDELHETLPESLVFQRFPSPRTGRLAGARDARIVYVRTRVDHMQLVTGGVVLPMVLRAMRLPVVKHASRKAPIRVW